MVFLEPELAAYLAVRGEPGDAADFVAWLNESLKADPIIYLDLAGGGFARRSGASLRVPSAHDAIPFGPTPVGLAARIGDAGALHPAPARSAFGPTV